MSYWHISSLSLLVHPCVYERRASTLSWCHHRLIELRPSFISPWYGRLIVLCSILYTVTESHDNVTFKKLQNVWFLNLCCFACDAIKLKNLKPLNCSQNTLLVNSSKWLKWMLYRRCCDVLGLREVHIDASLLWRLENWVGEFQVWNLIYRPEFEFMHLCSFIPIMQMRQTWNSPCNVMRRDEPSEAIIIVLILSEIKSETFSLGHVKTIFNTHFQVSTQLTPKI